MKPWIAEQRNWHACYWKKSPKVKASTIRSFHLIKKQVATCYLAIIFFLRCTWIPSRLQKCTDFQYSWLSLFPAAAIQLLEYKVKVAQYRPVKVFDPTSWNNLLVDDLDNCKLSGWLPTFQDDCKLFRMISNFSGWLRGLQCICSVLSPELRLVIS